MGLSIEPIADHLDLLPVIGRWHWEEWGHVDQEGSLESWTEGLAERTNRGAIPTTLVALDGETPIGSVTLVEHDMDTRTDLSPWLAGLFVAPERRGEGAGSALVREAVQLAAKLGVETLYLYTRSAGGLYERLGWRAIGTEFYEGREVTIMSIDPARPT